MEKELKSICINEMNLNKEQLDALTQERKWAFEDKKERIKNIIGFEIYSYRPDFYKGNDEFLYWENVKVVQ